MEDFDYSRYPMKDLQVNWITHYLTEYNGKPPTEKEVESLFVQVNQFALLSHLVYGLWGLVQTEHSDINYDYLRYV